MIGGDRAAPGARRRLGTLEPSPVEVGRSGVLSLVGRARRASNARLVFLLSAERSGSTLLSLTLGANPRHVVPPELHLLAYATFEDWRREYPDALESLRFVLRACDIDADDDEMDRAFAGWTPGSVYEWLLNGRLRGDRVLVDKTPKYAREPAILERLESLRPHYIWLVRHPLGVAASQIALRRARRERGASGWIDRAKLPLARMRDNLLMTPMVRDEIGYWRDLNSNIESFLSGVDDSRWMHVSYERFVRDPEPVLRDLSAWLGSRFDPAMLSPQNHVPGEMTATTGDPKIRTHRKIDPTVADGWRGQVSESLLDDVTRALMKRWGVPDDGGEGPGDAAGSGDDERSSDAASRSRRREAAL